MNDRERVKKTWRGLAGGAPLAQGTPYVVEDGVGLEHGQVVT